MTMTQFHAEFIFRFGSQSRKSKVSTSAYAMDDITSVKLGELKKTHSQVCAQKNKKKIVAGTDRIK